MRENNIKTKKNNKGISLIEIIVAIAVGSLVLASLTILIVQGVNSYRTQSTLANLQNDANIALNQISDNIMEGTCFKAYNTNIGSPDGTLYTSYFQIKDNVYYVYDNIGKVLYQSQAPSYTDASASVLCENVENFTIQMFDYNVIVDDNNKIQGVTNPIQLQVHIKVAKLGESRETDRTISMRNDMTQIELVVDGEEENKTIIGYDISSLKNYITSDN